LDRVLTKMFHNEKSVMEIANNYYMLSQEFFSNSKFPLEGWVCLLRALNLAESLDPSPLLVGTYSSIAFQLATRFPYFCSLFGFFFKYYWKMGNLAEKNSHLGKKTIGWTSLLDAWGKTAYGELDCAAEKFEKVSRICEESGWSSLCWQARLFKAVIECIKGDFNQAEKTLNLIRSKSPMTTPAQEFWTTTVELGIHVNMDRDLDQSFELLERSKKIRSEWKPKGTRWFNTPSVHETISCGFSCFLHFRKRDPMALEYAEQFVALNRHSSFVIFSGTHICIKVIAEAICCIWREKISHSASNLSCLCSASTITDSSLSYAQNDYIAATTTVTSDYHLSSSTSFIDLDSAGTPISPPSSPVVSGLGCSHGNREQENPWKTVEIARLREVMSEVVSILNQLCTIYVVAEATLLLYKGIRAKLEGESKKAKALLTKGLGVSQKLNLRLEEGLFLLELTLMEPSPSIESLVHACDIIESTGANYHAMMARKYANLQHHLV